MFGRSEAFQIGQHQFRPHLNFSSGGMSQKTTRHHSNAMPTSTDFGNPQRFRAHPPQTTPFRAAQHKTRKNRGAFAPGLEKPHVELFGCRPLVCHCPHRHIEEPNAKGQPSEGSARLPLPIETQPTEASFPRDGPSRAGQWARGPHGTHRHRNQMRCAPPHRDPTAAPSGRMIEREGHEVRVDHLHAIPFWLAGPHPGMHWTVGEVVPPPLFQGARPMPSHCPPDGKCRRQWHL